MPVKDNLAEYLGELDVPLDQRRQAMRVVATASVDADECGLLLDMLGLKPDQARPQPRQPLTDLSATAPAAAVR